MGTVQLLSFVWLLDWYSIDTDSAAVPSNRKFSNQRVAQLTTNWNITGKLWDNRIYFAVPNSILPKHLKSPIHRPDSFNSSTWRSFIIVSEDYAVSPNHQPRFCVKTKTLWFQVPYSFYGTYLSQRAWDDVNLSRPFKKKSQNSIAPDSVRRRLHFFSFSVSRFWNMRRMF